MLLCTCTVSRNNYGLLLGASHCFPPNNKCAEHDQIQRQGHTEGRARSSTTPLKPCLQVRTKAHGSCNKSVPCSTDSQHVWKSDTKIQTWTTEKIPESSQISGWKPMTEVMSWAGAEEKSLNLRFSPPQFSVLLHHQKVGNYHFCPSISNSSHQTVPGSELPSTKETWT